MLYLCQIVCDTNPQVSAQFRLAVNTATNIWNTIDQRSQCYDVTLVTSLWYVAVSC